MKATVIVDSVCTGSPTLSVSTVGGTAIKPSNESNLLLANEYQHDGTVRITAATSALRITLAGATGSGSGEVVVQYTMPQN